MADRVGGHVVQACNQSVVFVSNLHNQKYRPCCVFQSHREGRVRCVGPHTEPINHLAVHHAVYSGDGGGEVVGTVPEIILRGG